MVDSRDQLDEKDDARDDLDEAGDEEQHAGLYRVRVGLGLG